MGKKLHSFEYFLHAEVAVFFLRTLQIKGKLTNSRFSLFETGVLVLFGKYNPRVTGLINNLLVKGTAMVWIEILRVESFSNQ